MTNADPGWYPVDAGQRYWDGAAWTDEVRPTPLGTTAPSAAEILDQIERLGALRYSGVLTPEEFAAKKAELLARL